MMKTILTGCLLSIALAYSNAQVVSIPDANFKNALLSDPAINTNNDSEIQVSEAQSFNGNMTVNALNISNMAGLEAFTALKGLACSGNPLGGNLDISQNVALNNLHCEMIQLTNLDISHNVNLLSLKCAHNQLTSLDLTNNAALTILDCMYNQISQLDVSPCIFLENINAANNPLTSINLSTNIHLTGLNCAMTQITSVDLSNNPQMQSVGCYLMPSLEQLNLANGNQTNYQMILAHDNPNLTCTQVDNLAYSVANWSDGVYFDFDPQHTFDMDCFTTTTGVSENGSLNSLQFYPNPASDFLYLQGELSVLRKVSLFDLNGKCLKEWTRDFQQLSVVDLEPGIYLMTLAGESGESVKTATISIQ